MKINELLKQVDKINPYTFNYKNDSEVTKVLNMINELHDNVTDWKYDVVVTNEHSKEVERESRKEKEDRCENGYKDAKQLQDAIKRMNILSTFMLGLQNNRMLDIDINHAVNTNDKKFLKDYNLSEELNRFDNLDEESIEVLKEDIDFYAQMEYVSFQQKYEFLLESQEFLARNFRNIATNIGAIDAPEFGIEKITLGKIINDIDNTKSFLDKNGNIKRMFEKGFEKDNPKLKAMQWHLILSEDIDEIDRIINILTAYDNNTPTNKKFQEMLKFYRFDHFQFSAGQQVSNTTYANEEFNKVIATHFFNDSDGPLIQYFEENEQTPAQKTKKEEQLKILSSTKLDCIKTRDDLENFLIGNNKQITISRLSNGCLEFTIEKNHALNKNIEKGYKTKIESSVLENELTTTYTYNPNSKMLTSLKYSTQTTAFGISSENEIDKNLSENFEGFLGQIESMVDLNTIQPGRSKVTLNATSFGIDATKTKKYNDNISISTSASIHGPEIGTDGVNKGSISVKSKLKEKKDGKTRTMSLINLSTGGFVKNFLNLVFNDKKLMFESVKNTKEEVENIYDTYNNIRKQVINQEGSALDNLKSVHEEYNKLSDLEDDIKSFDAMFDRLTGVTTERDDDKKELLTLTKYSINKLLKKDPKEALETFFEVDNYNADDFTSLLNEIKDPESYMDVIDSYTGKERKDFQAVFRETLEERFPKILDDKNAASKYTHIFNSRHGEELLNVYNNDIEFQVELNKLINENPNLKNAFLKEQKRVQDKYKSNDLER